MKTIDEIIDEYVPYSKGIPTYDREDIRDMMKQYGVQILNTVVDARQSLFHTWNGGQVYKNEDLIEDIKQNIQNG